MLCLPLSRTHGPSPGEASRLASAGLSTVEVVLVIVLVGILGAVTFPSVAGFSRPFRVQSAGREVYAALHDVRQQAITRGVRTRFQVVGTNKYRLQWENAGAWTTIRGPIELEKNVALASSGGDVTFLPRGTAAPLTTITISDVEKPEHDMVITVPITGLVRIRAGGG